MKIYKILKNLRRFSTTYTEDVVENENFAKTVLKNTPNIDYIPYLSKSECLAPMTNSIPFKNEISNQIDDKGSMPFIKYMESALTHPKHGYYMKRDVFNKTGDFVTSPEISQMFGECVGVWVIQFLQQMKAVDVDEKVSRGYQLLEFGPGKCTLMEDVMRI